MSELPSGMTPAAPAEPRPAAAAIVLRPAESAGWEVLVGRRAMGSRFLPGFVSFPGGTVEEQDAPEEPGVLARCASRELREETRLEVSTAEWRDAGVRVTPPFSPLRFRTRYFVAEVPRGCELPDDPPSPEELDQVWFAAPGELLEDWRRGRLRIAPPVLPLLEVVGSGAGMTLVEIARRARQVNEEEERAPRIELGPGLWMWPVRSETLPPATHTNVWMPGGSRFVIVDPGSADAEEQRRLLAVIARRRAAGDRPHALLLTHHHRDHVAGAKALSEALALPLRAHRSTLDRLSEVPRTPVAPLEDGEQIDLGGETLIAFHTPGHAPGHLAFLLPSRGLLLCGDLISGISTILIDPGDGEMGDYLASLERARGLGCRGLLPGHGPPLAASRLERLIEHRRRREMLVFEQLDAQGKSLPEIARGAYAEQPQLPDELIRRQALSHLLHLKRLGSVRTLDGQGTRWGLT